MKNFALTFSEINYNLPMVFVEGTKGNPYFFGAENEQRKINIQPFFISQFPVTQKLWDYIMHNGYRESESLLSTALITILPDKEAF